MGIGGRGSVRPGPDGMSKTVRGAKVQGVVLQDPNGQRVHPHRIILHNPVLTDGSCGGTGVHSRICYAKGESLSVCKWITTLISFGS